MLDGAEGVASTANAGWGGCEIEDGFQALVLEVDASYAPKGRVRFEMELDSTVEVGDVEMGMENIVSMTV